MYLFIHNCSGIANYVRKSMWSREICCLSKSVNYGSHAYIQGRGHSILLLEGTGQLVEASCYQQLQALQATGQQGAHWFAQAISLLPKESATEEDKARLLLATAEVAGRDEFKARIG